MPISVNSYGSVTGVQAYIRHMTLDATNNPTTAQIEAFIDEMSAILNGWLAAAGYTVPVSTPSTAVSILGRYANVGAAGMAELTQRSSGYAANAPNNRENKFLDEFYKAEAFINSGALGNLGVPEATGADQPYFGLHVGGHTTGGGALKPIFRRGSFGADPTAESPNREKDWTDQ